MTSVDPQVENVEWCHCTNPKCGDLHIRFRNADEIVIAELTLDEAAIDDLFKSIKDYLHRAKN